MTDYSNQADKLLSLLPNGWDVSIHGGFDNKEWRITASHEEYDLSFVLDGSKEQELNDELIFLIAEQVTKELNND